MSRAPNPSVAYSLRSGPGSPLGSRLLLVVPAQPSDAYLTRVLDAAYDAPIASPVPGAILSLPRDPTLGAVDEERPEQDAPGEGTSAGRRFARGSKGKRGRGKVGRRARSRSSSASMEGAPAGLKEAVSRARAAEADGEYVEREAFRDGGKVEVVRAGVRVGRGLGIYHRFAQGEGDQAAGTRVARWPRIGDDGAGRTSHAVPAGYAVLGRNQPWWQRPVVERAPTVLRSLKLSVAWRSPGHIRFAWGKHTPEAGLSPKLGV